MDKEGLQLLSDVILSMEFNEPYMVTIPSLGIYGVTLSMDLWVNLLNELINLR